MRLTEWWPQVTSLICHSSLVGTPKNLKVRGSQLFFEVFPSQRAERKQPTFKSRAAWLQVSHSIRFLTSPPGTTQLLLLLLLLLLSHFSRVRLCSPMESSPPGSPVPGILQARTLEWVAISFSSAWKWKVKVKSLSRVRLYNPMDYSLPGSSVHGIFQARVPMWVAIAFSNNRTTQGKLWMLLLLNHFSRVWLCATPWTAAHQVPPSMGFSRQEYWSGVPLPSPEIMNTSVYKWDFFFWNDGWLWRYFSGHDPPRLL